MPQLCSEPKTVRLDLTEWVRFDCPRHYRLTKTSSRVIEGKPRKILPKNAGDRASEVDVGQLGFTCKRHQNTLRLASCFAG